MATYAIGDLQGCHAEFLALLAKVDFSVSRDRLWLTGDLVNRGPDSLAVLRSVMALGERVTVVLGNHDLHLLACAWSSNARPRRRDTLNAVLAAPDRDDLLAWLRRQPLFHYDAKLGYAMVHAGLPPQWTLAEAAGHAVEVEAALRGPAITSFLANLYGSEPSQWDDTLVGADRLRFITNCFTRIRYCDLDGRLNLDEKGQPATQPAGLLPWFELPQRASRDTRIVFGHWSTLRLAPEECHRHAVWPLDTGAVWGGELTAMRLEDGALFHVPSSVVTALD